MGDVTPIVGRKRGKKPVNLVSASGHRDPQDMVWEGIRALKVFTQADIEVWMLNKFDRGINSKTVRSYISRLVKGNYLEVTKSETARNISKRFTYELVKDAGTHSPRLKKTGEPSTQGLGRENLWRAMKILKNFDWRELVDVCNTNEVTIKPSEAKDYIRHLNGAGYLKVVQKSVGNTPARYNFVPSMNTGYHPPMIQRIKRVFDPNLNKVMEKKNEDES